MGGGGGDFAVSVITTSPSFICVLREGMSVAGKLLGRVLAPQSKKQQRVAEVSENSLQQSHTVNNYD